MRPRFLFVVPRDDESPWHADQMSDALRDLVPRRRAVGAATLLSLRIDTVDPGLGIEVMRLTATRADALDAVVLPAAFGGDNKSDDLAPLIDQLSARIGSAALFKVAPVESDVPERATARVGPLERPVKWTEWRRPARLLRRPELLHNVVALLPDAAPRRFTWRGKAHVVIAGDGPERIFGEAPGCCAHHAHRAGKSKEGLMAEQPQSAGLAPKVDPETLVLRARPQLAARFKRGVIIGAAAVGAGGVATLGYVALRPHIHVAGDQPSDLSQPATSGTPDSLNGLPSSYGSVPKLGPPLPGDLGKPILEHQQTSLGDAEPIPSPSSQNAVLQERQRAADDLRAARQSGLLVQTKSDAAPASIQPGSDGAPANSATTAAPASLDPTTDPNGQLHKADFVRAVDRDGPVNPHSMTPAASPNMLSAGTVIAGSLITGLRSDLPGLVTALVSENVFDSATGHILLVPQGARLIGNYDSVVAFGQRRALVVWQRIIWPDGSSLSIDNVPGADPSGYSGLEDKVDFHTWQLLKGVAISTLLGVGTDLQFSGNGGLIEAIRQSGTQNVSRAGDQLTSKALDIQPTITIRPGAPIRLVVHRDIVVEPWERR